MWFKIKTKKYHVLIILIVFIIIFFVFYSQFKNKSSSVAIIPITGFIYSSPQYNTDGSVDKSNAYSLEIVSKIRKANEDRRVKAIVFVIDSNGGEIFTAEEITSAIKEVKKPTVSLIRSRGISSAYWIASATGRIFALPLSGTVDIGVTNSYTDNSKQNNDSGITFHQLSYGKFKDMYNTDKEMTPDEEKLAIEQTTEQANVFIKEISENRHLPIEKVKALADGSIILGQDAIKLGLIDEIGSYPEVEKYLSKILKMNVKIDISTNKDKEGFK